MKKAFLLSELVIYLSFIVLDCGGYFSSYIKYTGIVLCFLFSLYKSNTYRILAFALTLIADYFLLIANRNYELGLMPFVLVQIVYCLLLKKRYKRTYILFRFAFVVLGVCALFIINNISLLNILVVVYFSNLFINAVCACCCKNFLLATGLALFVCCDVCVGFNFISPNNFFLFFLIWVFYLPSQVLIALA